MEAIELGTEDHGAAQAGLNLHGAFGHLGIPQFEVAPEFRIPVLIEIN